MRIILHLHSEKIRVLPYNYQYPLSAAIYKLLRSGSGEYATFLHDRGYKLAGKTYKLFCFALRFEKAKFSSDHLEMLSPNVRLYISSPLIDKFMGSLLSGVFRTPEILFDDPDMNVRFRVSNIETVPSPVFSSEMKFRLLSPLVVSTRREIAGRLATYYLRYDDDISELNRIINMNLRNKLQLLTGVPHDDKSIEFGWDNSYIAQRTAEGKSLTSRITIGSKNRNISVIANMIPFIVTGDTSLIETGYMCGFGEKNSMGFGFSDTIRAGTR